MLSWRLNRATREDRPNPVLQGWLVIIFAFIACEKKQEEVALNRYPFAISAPTERQQAFERELARFEERVRGNPSRDEDLAQLALHYVEKGRRTWDLSWLDKAEAMAKKSRSVRSNRNRLADLALAEIASEKYRYDDAIPPLKRILTADPSDFDAALLLIQAYLGSGENDVAQTVAESLAKAKPCLKSLIALGQIYETNGRAHDAEQAYLAAMTLEGAGDGQASAQVRTLLAQFNINQGKLENVRWLVNEALRIRPDDTRAVQILAELEAQWGHLELAVELYAQAYRISPDPQFLVAQAKIARRRGDGNAAAELFRHAELAYRERIHQSAVGHRRELAELLLDRGRPQDLVEALRLVQADALVRDDQKTRDTLARAQQLNAQLRGE